MKGVELKKIRVDNGYTQESLANAVNSTRVSIARNEKKEIISSGLEAKIRLLLQSDTKENSDNYEPEKKIDQILDYVKDQNLSVKNKRRIKELEAIIEKQDENIKILNESIEILIEWKMKQDYKESQANKRDQSSA